MSCVAKMCNPYNGWEYYITCSDECWVLWSLSAWCSLLCRWLGGIRSAVVSGGGGVVISCDKYYSHSIIMLPLFRVEP